MLLLNLHYTFELVLYGYRNEQTIKNQAVENSSHTLCALSYVSHTEEHTVYCIFITAPWAGVTEAHLEAWRAHSGPTSEKIHLAVRLAVFKLDVATRISTALYSSVRPKVPMEKRH